MTHLTTTDNHDWTKLPNADIKDIENLKLISNVKISELSNSNNHNLLVFPRDFNQYGDKINESCILSLSGDKISTGNIMGFVGINETQLTIRSRFDEGNNSDYFMHYMLQRVFSINLFDMKHSTSADSIFDFLIYLFPYYLKKASAQGLFKKYRRFEHNDANVKGSINITLHIRQNIPFHGTVAYTTRDHSYDNEITQLVRHTIEYIRLKEAGKTILSSDSETKNCVSQIVMATPSYSNQKRVQIINQNLRPVRHPYFSEYTALQKLCIQILRHEAIKFGEEKDQVYGVLFDGAWLWEEYLYTILKDLGLKNCYRKLYPDFYNDTKKIILDAKYKHLDGKVGREDLYQVVTYMHCMNYQLGGYLYPADKACQSISYKLAGMGGTIKVIPLQIPQTKQNWDDFIKDMKSSENKFISQL